LTFSSAVISRNSFRFWNVRRIPAAARRPVGADQAMDIASRNLHVDRIDRDQSSEPARQ
jgi:hypothetical protein